MEELLASIRKAIHDDIGEVPPTLPPRQAGSPQRGPAREYHAKVADDTVTAAAEIQQLREKISRSRTAETAAAREVPGRQDSIAAALKPEPSRRSWRDLEAQPQLRPTIVEPEPLPAPPRVEYQVRREPVPELAPRAEYQPRREPMAELPPTYHATSWHDEPPALPPPPRESYRARPDSGPILSGDASHAVNAAFARLAETMIARSTGDRSLEEITRDMLRTMLKQWLDDNLPAMVERLVREEIERVARSGR